MDHNQASSLEFKSAWMQRRVEQAQSMYQRVLVAWASDVLELRRIGRANAVWGTAPSLGLASAEYLEHNFTDDNQFDEPMNDAA
ncbi:MAG: hypothetical protein QM516_02370 [Limnohabitans sp.]|nr:hypothetical protein [Limnohabitans sp.]